MSHPSLQMSPNLNSNTITHAEQRKPKAGWKRAACLGGSAEGQGTREACGAQARLLLHKTAIIH